MVRIRSKTGSVADDCYSSEAESPRSSFRHRFRTTSGTYLKNQIKPKQGYEEPVSVRTDDAGGDFQCKSTARSMDSRLPKPINGYHKQIESDLESVQTEDFQSEFSRTIVPAGQQRTDMESEVEPENKYLENLLQKQKQLLHSQLEREKRMASTVSRKPPHPSRNYRNVLSNYKNRGYDTVTDLETAGTDDIDYAQTGRHVAGVNLENFDEVLVDSDMDTVRTADVRNRLKNAMANGKGRSSRKLADISPLPRIDASVSDVEQQEDQVHEELYQNDNDTVILSAPQNRDAIALQYGFYDQDDMTSQDEEMKHNSLEIHRASRRIAREMEDERRQRIAQRQKQQKLVARSIERLPTKAAQAYKSESPERQPLRAAQSLDCLSQTSPKSRGVTRVDRPNVEAVENAVCVTEIKEKLVELQVLAGTVDKAKTEKRTLIAELKNLREAYSDRQNEIKLAKMHSRDYKKKSDQLKSELNVLEYKKSQMKQELEDTEQNLSTKKTRMDEIDQRIEENLDRLKDFEELGMTAEQVKGVITEKDKLQSDAGKQEALEKERDSLQEKLLETKEELFDAAKKHRARVEALEEKLDDIVQQNQDLQTDKSYLQQQLRMVDDTHNKAIEEKDVIIKETEENYNNLNGNLQGQLDDLRQETTLEKELLKQEIEVLQARSKSLQEDLEQRNEATAKLKDEIIKLQSDLRSETELREKEGTEYKGQVATLEEENDKAMTDMREKLYAAKHAELQDAYEMFEQERRKLAAQQETKLSAQLAQHHQELMTCEEENLMLREQVRIAEENTRSAEIKARNESKTQFELDMDSARLKWEAEKDRVWKLELAKVSDESARAVQHAREDADREKNFSQQLERQIEIMRQELEEQRLVSRQSYKEKLESIDRIKETARVECEAAVERTRARALEESGREIECLKLQLETQQEEIQRMCTEAEAAQNREQEQQTQTQKHDKTIVHEINDDCKKTALLLGVTPRKALTRQQQASPAGNAINAALANLRACNEQLRSYVVELKQELDSQRSVMVSMQREKDEVLTAQKEKLTAEKTTEMDMLRERLVKDHMEELVQLQMRSPDKAMKQSLIDKDAELREIQKSMGTWKEEVAEKFAKKFEAELNRELEKRTRELKRDVREKERTLAQQQRDIERLDRECTRLTAQRLF